jgi:hypothetical protein
MPLLLLGRAAARQSRLKLFVPPSSTFVATNGRAAARQSRLKLFVPPSSTFVATNAKRSDERSATSDDARHKTRRRDKRQALWSFAAQLRDGRGSRAQRGDGK